MRTRPLASATLAGFIAFSLTACQPADPLAGSGKPPLSSGGTTTSLAAPLPKIMARNCQGCHSVRLYLPSPNPAAPGFADIANYEGLTPNTLSAFLRAAHNYPDEMKMTLTPSEVEEIVAYVLTLRDPNYRPIP